MCGIHDFLEVDFGRCFVTTAISRAFSKLKLEASQCFKYGLIFARQRVT